MSGGRWLKPFPLPEVASVASLARLDDSTWIVSGRLTKGGGFAALYCPTPWELSALAGPPTRAFVGAGSSLEREIGLVVGSEGVVLRLEGGAGTTSRVH